MDCNRYRRTSCYLSDHVGSQLILGLGTDIDIAIQFCPSALVDNIGSNFSITNECCILLTRIDTGAISCKSIIDCSILTIKLSQLRLWMTVYLGNLDLVVTLQHLGLR